MKQFEIGIDEVAKSPVIGSIIICCVVVHNPTFFRKWQHLGIKDSKQLTIPKIKVIYEQTNREIEHYLEYIKPLDIEIGQSTGKNLNDLEMRKIISLLNCIKEFWKHKINIDNFECDLDHFITRFTILSPNNLNQYAIRAMKTLGDDFFKNFNIKHGNDKQEKSCSLASIYAKYFEEKEKAENKLIYGDIGNGNPNDLKTMKFLYEQKQKENTATIIRKTWATWKNLDNPEEMENLKKKLEALK